MRPIFATPTMDRAESKRIYRELRETQPTEAKAERLREADGVFARAQKRALLYGDETPPPRAAI